MSFLKNIFGGNSSNDEKVTNQEPKFYTLKNIDQLDEINTISNERSVVLFKHSTRCSISRFALKRFDAEYDYTDEQMDWYLLDLLEHRDISNAIATKYEVMHQSPQIIVIKNGKAIFTTSHDAIDAGELKQFV
ncbi:MAG: bacillithiol system redox-active protein YtxJ [Flavobacterium sp.]|nr:bacillithiol system redox-active protein YtxJ [Flavobacterium sp.]